ncbi:Uncharacterised protein [Vibrio alginolyticus]|nr:Uncharacterised protein [Vibrio alginolyticus]
MVTSLEVISSLTIWKADKTIFKIVCKVFNVCSLWTNTKKNTFKCSWEYHFYSDYSKLSPAKSNVSRSFK